jgi:isochorismate hydrolase
LVPASEAPCKLSTRKRLAKQLAKIAQKNA